MDKVKKLINCPVPVTACNFKCKYCYVGQTDGFKGEIRKLDYTPEFMAYAMRKERMGGPCLINFCGGGETLLAPYILDLTKLLLTDGHYVTIVTNGSLSNKFDEILTFPQEILKRLFVKFSFHYLELKRMNLFDVFFANVEKIKNSPASFTIELTANDDSVEYIDDIKKLCKERLGALCHIIESRNDTTPELKRLTKMDEKEHLAIWESFDTNMISFQKTTWGIHRKEFCYAGDWLMNLTLENGNVYTCLKYGAQITNIYENPDEPLHLTAIGQNCPWAHCFSSYFLLTNGCIPELDTPCYGAVRDRICDDGTEWLKPEFKSFFFSKLKESNDIYSQNKKDYINSVMSITYKNKQAVIDKKHVAEILEKELLSKGVNSIYILNLNEYSKFLISVLKMTKIKVCGIAITKKDTFTRNLGLFFKNLINKMIFSGNPKIGFAKRILPQNATVVVTDYVHFTKHKMEIDALNKNIKVYSLTELVS